MSGWYPQAVRKPIPAGDNDPVIVPSMAILHVAVSNALSLYPYFRHKSGGVESHFYIRKDGTVEQYRSVLREADANYRANSYEIGGVQYGAVSIETQGMALGKWSPAQLESIQNLLLWLHDEHKIRWSPVFHPQPTPYRGGVSYHSRFRDWSNVRGKTCPGPRRINQYRNIIVPWMLEQRRQFHTVQPGDTPRTLSAQYSVDVAELWRWNRKPLVPGEKVRVK